ncbi:phage tail tape measure protein [Bacillus sp. FSL W7-1360]
MVGRPLGNMIIELDMSGTKFQRSLDGIRRQLKTAQNELKAKMSVISQAGDGYKTMEAKVAGLTKVMAANEQQLAILHERYEQAKNDYGENSKEAQRYAAQINDAVAKQSAMQKRLEDAEIAMRDYKRGTQDTRTQLDQAGRSMQAQVSVLQMQGRQYAASKATLEGLSEQHRLQGELVDKEKEKLNDLIAVKGEDARETREQQVVVKEAIANHKIMEAQLGDLEKQIGGVGDAYVNAADRLTNFSDKMRGVADQLKHVGRELTTKVTMPIVAGVGAAVAAAIEFEDSFAGFKKVTDATAQEFTVFKQAFRDLSKEIPVATSEINEVAAAASQLGIKKENVLGFTETMLAMGVASDLTSEQASFAFARLANITKMPQQNFDRLGSSIVELGNNFAATESEISEMALRVAGAGTQVGMTEADILGFSTALTAVGINAEAGGTAISKLIIETAAAVDEGGASLKQFSDVAGMSTSEFKQAFEEDAASAVFMFLGGLGELSEQGESAFKIIDEMGLSEIRLRDTILRTSNARELANDALETANRGWEENTALEKEAAERYETTASKLKILWNHLKDLGLQIGDLLLPMVNELIVHITNVITVFSGMSDGMKLGTVIVAGLAAAVGPLVLTLGLFAASISSIAGVMAKASIVMGKWGGVAGILRNIFSGLRVAFLAFTGPIGLIVAGVAAVAAGFVLAYKKIEPFRAFINQIGAAIMRAFGNIKAFFSGDILGNVKNILPPELLTRLQVFGDGVKTVFQTLKQLVLQAVSVMTDFAREKFGQLSAFWDQNGNQILQALQNAFQGIKTVVTAVFSAVMTVAKPLLSFLFDIGKTVLPYVVEAFKFGFNVILSVVKMVWENIKGVINGALNVIMGTIKIFTGLFTGDFRAMWEGVKQLFFGAVEAIWNVIQLMFWGRLLKGVVGFAQMFTGFFRGMWNGIKAIFTTVIQFVVNFVKNSFTGMVNVTKSIFNAFKNVIHTVIKAVNNIISSIIRAVVGFVTRHFTKMKDQTTAVFTALRDTVKRIWDAIRSRIVDPVKRTVDNVRSYFGSMRQRVIDIFNGMRNKVGEIISKMIDTVKAMPKKMGDGLKRAAKNIGGGIKEVSKLLLEGLAKGVNGVIGGVNWILDKVGVDSKIPKWKLPEYAKGTKGHPGGLAVVGDGGEPELIRYPDGQFSLSPATDTLLNLPKGTQVLSGRDTATLLHALPAYKDGTGAWDWIKNAGSNIANTVKGGVSALKDSAIDVWDWVTDGAKKLLDKVLETMGVEVPDMNGSFGKIARGSFGFIKNKMVSFVDGEMNEGMPEGGGGHGFPPPFRKSSSFNPRRKHPITGKIQAHNGDDWAAPPGTRIPSQSGGRVSYSGRMGGYGNIVIVKGGGGLEYRYAHNSRNLVRLGDAVKPGQTVALVGSTGDSTGPHLHFEVRRGGKPLNPSKYENGGFSLKHKLAEISEGNKPEAIIPLHRSKRSRAMQLLAKANEIVGFDHGGQVHVQNDNTDIIAELVKGQAMMQQQIDLLQQLLLKDQHVYLDGQKITDDVSRRQGKQYQRLAWQGGV